LTCSVRKIWFLSKLVSLGREEQSSYKPFFFAKGHKRTEHNPWFTFIGDEED
jgi:hypothetical protein